MDGYPGINEPSKRAIIHSPSGFFAKSACSYQDNANSLVDVKEFEGIDVAGAPILCGFPTTSLTSVLVSGYTVEQLKLPLVGVITSNKFPPKCVIEKGVPAHPVRIYGDKRIVVIVCEFQMPSHEVTYAVVGAILRFAERHSSPIVIAIEGLPSETVDPNSAEQHEILHFVSTNMLFADKMAKLGHQPVEEGVISGVTGLLLAEGSLSKVDVACLLAPSSSKYPDAYAAVVVVKTLSNYLPTAIDHNPLLDRAQKLQNTVTKFLKAERAATKGAIPT